MPQVIPALLLTLAVQAHTTGFRADFPSRRPVETLPGFVRVEWLEPSTERPQHLLRFSDASGKVAAEYPFTRHVRVLADKAAGWIVVTDYTGSSESTALAFRLDQPSRKLDLRRELQRDPKLAPLLSGNDHTYVEAVSLSPRGEVTVKVSGYGPQSPKGFTLRKALRLGTLQP